MADQMDLAPGLSQRFVDGLVQAALDQQVRAFRIDADARKIRPVPNAAEPGVKLHKVEIGAEKPGMRTTPEPSPRATPKP